ncbi:PREDICTED: uncharacterized protein LOC105995899 [Dipodomys ordii]|uniref:Uncharacterized protein LOC105995899 n=1 Tax=Dipodomys ordii TaxID=10020 RepID=A0A1S3GB68_DIPOR|nr:PREDICTED: uncharacterized protein LOC105995899 [Dipodomys ordii]
MKGKALAVKPKGSRAPLQPGAGSPTRSARPLQSSTQSRGRDPPRAFGCCQLEGVGRGGAGHRGPAVSPGTASFLWSLRGGGEGRGPAGGVPSGGGRGLGLPAEWGGWRRTALAKERTGSERPVRAILAPSAVACALPTPELPCRIPGRGWRHVSPHCRHRNRSGEVTKAHDLGLQDRGAGRCADLTLCSDWAAMAFVERISSSSSSSSNRGSQLLMAGDSPPPLTTIIWPCLDEYLVTIVQRGKPGMLPIKHLQKYHLSPTTEGKRGVNICVSVLRSKLKAK